MGWCFDKNKSHIIICHFSLNLHNRYVKNVTRVSSQFAQKSLNNLHTLSRACKPVFLFMEDIFNRFFRFCSCKWLQNGSMGYFECSNGKHILCVLFRAKRHFSQTSFKDDHRLLRLQVDTSIFSRPSSFVSLNQLILHLNVLPHFMIAVEGIFWLGSFFLQHCMLPLNLCLCLCLPLQK